MTEQWSVRTQPEMDDNGQLRTMKMLASTHIVGSEAARQLSQE